MKRKFSLFVTIVVCLLIAVGILSACNDDSEQDPGVHVHSMELIAAKGATCTEEGNNAYYYCSGCNKYFKDEAGTQGTTVEAETIPAAGHNWDNGEITTAATCTTDGVMTYTCLDCAETKIETSPALGHGMTIIKAKDATCTEAGNNAYYHCTRCNKYFKDIEGEEETTVEAETISARHKIVDGKCTICGKLYTVGLKYSLSGDGAYYIVTGIGTASGDIIIPDTHEGLPVKEIGDDAFLDCSSLTSIEIPAGVTSIGYEAFFGCSILTDVSFAEGSQLTSIGSYAFYGCSNLESVTFAEGSQLTSIGSDAFRDCSSLTSIEIPAGVTSIGSDAFEYCINLESVTFAEGSQLTSIGSSAFYGCSGLTSIEIPAGVTVLPDGGWNGSRYEGVFSGCSNLESVTFAEGSQLTSIGIQAFYECSSLTSIEIPAGVTSIGDWAFHACSNLESVTFAEGSELTSIGGHAFEDCSNLNTVYYAGSIEDWFNIEFKREDSNPLYNGAELYIDGELVTAVVVPESITSIDTQLRGCTSLTSITIHSGVTSIGDWAFHACSNLESVTFAEGSQLTSIGYYAFSRCSSLKSIEIPAGVTELPDGATWYEMGVFSGCSNLESVTFAEGSQLTSIGDYAFSGCSNLDTVYYSGSIEDWLNIEFDSNPLTYGADLYIGGELLTEVVVPESITSIDTQLRGCTSLTSITIHSGVTSIGDDAFYGCSNLESVTFAEGSQLTSIGRYAFRDCISLKSIEIPAGVTSIGSYAFRDCSNLESVSFAEGSQLTSIGSEAFYGCGSLTSIAIPAGVTSIGDYAFYGCRLTIVYNYSDLEITAGSSGNGYVAAYAEVVLTSPDQANIDENGYVTYTDGEEVLLLGYLGSEKDIVIPEGVTRIAEYVFCRDDIVSVTLPESITEIGDYAFSGCYNLKEVYNNSALDITVGSTDHGQVAEYAAIVHASDESESIFDDESGFAIVDGVLYGYRGSATDIIIPETVTSIAEYAFYDCSNLESVTFAEGSQLTSIGERAFYGCSSLTSIDIPAGVTSIGSYAFYDCSNLESVTFAEGSQLTSIGERAFYGCSSLTSIEIPASVTSIGRSAFYGCDSLKSVTFAERSGLTSIGDYAFYNCSSLTSIEIPASVTSIGRSAFYGCDSLESVTFGEGSRLASIGNYAFNGCSSLTSIEIPAGVTMIGNYAFEDCSNLESVTFAEGGQLTSIGSYAFLDCSNLTSIEIPAGVTNIEDSAIYSCSKLNTVYYNGSIENWFNIEFKSSTSNPLYYGADLYIGGELVTEVVVPESITSIDTQLRGCTSLTSITIHSGVISIGSSAFEDCSSLTSIEIPSRVTSIGYAAFSGCSSLQSIEIPASVTSIGRSAFYGCDSLESVTFAEGSQLTTDIGYAAFQDCSSLTSISIPAGVTSIGDWAFEDCSNLESVIFAEGSQLTSIGSSAFQDCISLKSIEIPAGVTSIGDRAFYVCSSLTSIEIPAGVTSIGGYAFRDCSNLNTVYYSGSIEDWLNIEFGSSSSNPLYYGADLYIGGELVTEVVVPESITTIATQLRGCTSLTSITIHSGVISIGSSAFEDCSSLTSIEIPSRVTSIGYAAFSGCSSLQSIEIPAGVTSIGEHAFYRCSSLESVTFGEGSRLASIGRSAFYDCSSLISIEIPAGVTVLPDGDWYGSRYGTRYEGVFSGCSNLESVIFAEGSQLTSIGNYAFNGCSSLTSIEIPAGVTSIGDYAFRVCSSLETIYYNGTEEQWNSIDKGANWNYVVIFLGDAGAEA